MKYLSLILLFLPLISCINNATRPTQNSITLQRNDVFLKTGLYILTEDLQGVEIKNERNGKFYFVSSTPLASVDDVISTKLLNAKIDSGRVEGITLRFNEKGAEVIRKSSRNPDIGRVAVVIANKMMYSMEILGPITTDSMNIFLGNYSEEEIEALRQLIEQKK